MRKIKMIAKEIENEVKDVIIRHAESSHLPTALYGSARHQFDRSRAKEKDLSTVWKLHRTDVRVPEDEVHNTRM